ncbi:uncharacterized protein PV06_00950 [Exophiala oligosperma]|uniref:SET domain-containing protein n=2 Tax=Chaetothyriales TaxID=34395 RepID=A0A0D2B7Z7_9EURO|nr:uncharacterized protein PV06_00950 [Exophiala oligosperma]KAJ9633253.1 SET domain-containing protein 3 [Knufia peltigerae]KIW48356.1 hypothetical protein PV06_00950 [Exophiala oligosperma]
MTESSLLTTHPATNHYPVTAAPSLASPLPNGSLSDTNLQEEEEYTIKCICIYADDDGNTVYCPKCDTWQHIECYYHGKKVPEEHFCADCFPRDLDAKKATDRQKRRREALDGGDRKVKRPNTKTQKKKHKDSISAADQINGWHSLDRNDSVGSTKEGPPAKKPKTNHRTTGSVVSVNGESRKRAASNVQSYPSPSKSPQDLFRFPAIPTYTSEFLELYDRDQGNTNARDNEQTIQAANKLSMWRTEPSLVVSAPGQQPTAKSPFVHLNHPLDQSALPPVTVETISKKDTEFEGRFPTWRFLRLQSSVKKDEIVGEVRGQVGMLEEYCQQKSSSNRWQELRHPDPFVFFHPHMDIYIDSRKSGTQFRYIRRSCKPNVTLKTFVSDDDETHHCFVASKDIPAGSELTTTWFLDQGMFSVDAVQNDSEQAQSRRLDWVSRVLANFGDCACDSNQPCLLANFDRRLPAKSIDIGAKEKGGRKKKSKSKQAVSPLSTGQATNSRAGSEPKLLDDEDQFDRRSTSESTPSNPQSRDITPVNIAALDADPVLGNGLTARELRKIQMAERAFAQKEQEKKDQSGQGQSRKKKRTSGGSNLNTPGAASSRQLGPNSQPPTPSGHPLSRSHDQAFGSPPPGKGAYRRAKSSDSASRGEVKPERPVYVDAAVQTQTEECEMVAPSPKRRKFCTPTQRLLKRLLHDRAKHNQRSRSPTSPSTASMPGPSASTGVPDDVEMKDVVMASEITSPQQSPTDVKVSGSPVNVGTTTYPLPSQAAHTLPPLKSPGPPRLHLSPLPPVPTFSSIGMGATTSTNTAMTPGPATVVAQSPSALTSSSPFPMTPSAVVTPSPARKKLSLGDYLSRRAASTPSVEKLQSEGGIHLPAEQIKEGEPGSSSPVADPAKTTEEVGVKQEGDEKEYSPPEDVPPVGAKSEQARDD